MGSSFGFLQAYDCTSFATDCHKMWTKSPWRHSVISLHCRLLFLFVPSGFHHFFHYLWLSLGGPSGHWGLLYNQIVFYLLKWKYTLNGNFEVVLIYNLCGIMNNLCSLQAFPSALPGRGRKDVTDSSLRDLKLWQLTRSCQMKWLVRRSVWGNILPLSLFVSPPWSH